ncbi:MAG: HD domain-containing protein [Candidatus Microsaccharimonas sp.]
MIPTNTSVERVDELMRRSDAIYDDIDRSFDDEVRYRRMLRTGIGMAAVSLRNGNNINETGQQLLNMPSANPPTIYPRELESLAYNYGDVTRATLDRRGNPEPDARHAIHLMKLAAPYARELYPSLNPNKIATYALVHDLLEAYAGDVPSLGMSKLQEAEKHHNEAQALITFRKEFGDTWPELVELVESYEALADSEARFTKTFDKLDPGFTHFYSNGAQLKSHYGYSHDEFLGAIDEATKRMEPYSGEFPLVMHDRDELTRRVAQVAFKKVA